MIMKEKAAHILLPVLILLLSTAVSAQEPADTSGIENQVTDSLSCSDSMLDCHRYYMNREPELAAGIWRLIFRQCPDLSEEMYITGEAIYTDMLRNTGDEVYLDSVLWVLSQRTVYFGGWPQNNIRKSLVLNEYGGDDPARVRESLALLEEASDTLPSLFDSGLIITLMKTALKAWSLNAADTTELLNTYLKATSIAESALDANPGDRQVAAARSTIEKIYMASGAVTCHNIAVIFSSKVENNPRDTTLINKVFGLLERTGCQESAFYYTIALKLYANKRSAENLVRLAEINYRRGDSDKAVWYFSEAFRADTTPTVQSKVLTRVAELELESGKRQEARNRADHAFELDSRNGRALMIMAEACAGSKIGDAFDNHTAYLVAVDYLLRAKKADPSLAKEADNRIREYMKLFPTREEGFYRRITDEGTLYRVGGWINEVTVIRFRRE